MQRLVDLRRLCSPASTRLSRKPAPLTGERRIRRLACRQSPAWPTDHALPTCRSRAPPPSASNSLARRPAAADRPRRRCPAGFKIELFAEGLSGPRQMRRRAQRRHLRRGDRCGTHPRAACGRRTARSPRSTRSSPASSMRPSGSRSIPSGDNPQWVYVANTDSVVRFPYTSGDTKAAGKPETVDRLAAGRRALHPRHRLHQGRQADAGLGRLAQQCRRRAWASPPGGLPSWIAQQPLGASWGNETDRAGVLAFDPDGKNAAALRHRHPQLRRASPCIPPPAISIARPTNATASATTWCRTTSRA